MTSGDVLAASLSVTPVKCVPGIAGYGAACPTPYASKVKTQSTSAGRFSAVNSVPGKFTNRHVQANNPMSCAATTMLPVPLLPGETGTHSLQNSGSESPPTQKLAKPHAFPLPAAGDLPTLQYGLQDMTLPRVLKTIEKIYQLSARPRRFGRNNPRCRERSNRRSGIILPIHP